MKGQSHLNLLRDEVPVIVDQSQEAAHVSHSDWFGQFTIAVVFLGSISIPSVETT